jgi:metallophosphoesterase superfamily enzyme
MDDVANDSFYIRELEDLYDRVPLRTLTEGDRYVVFSDLHMGNGSRLDDFRINAELFVSVLRQFYRDRGYHLVLNGDVEELQRFSMREIVTTWRDV